ncbi:MAG: hypothetical protein RJQ14_13375 [Marinoscillum sp.]
MKKVSLVVMGLILLGTGFFFGTAVNKRFERIQLVDHDVLVLEAQLEECRND